MEQNKKVIAILGIVSIFAVIVAIALGIGLARAIYENNNLVEECDNMAELIQVKEDALILLDDWYTEDGYTDVITWWNDFEKNRVSLSNLRKTVETREDAGYATPEQLERLSAMEKEAQETRSILRQNQLKEEYNSILAAIEDQRIAAESVVFTYSYNGGGSSYATPSGGLTQQSGINYYDGRTETYYSSNVLYHHRTSEWTVDDEGFYRDSDGYYVVAASDKAEGSTFEGSKGTNRVYDNGCSPGVTDYYVAW